MIAVVVDKLTGYRCFSSAYTLAKSMNAACKPSASPTSFSRRARHRPSYQAYRSSDHDRSCLVDTAGYTPGTEPTYALGPLFVEIELRREARKAGEGGTNCQTRSLFETCQFAADSKLEEKIAQSTVEDCQGKQTNKRGQRA